MSEVLLVGPYGGRNLGDNLILEIILGELERTGVRPVVACSDPDIVRDLHDVETCPLLEYRRWQVESLKRLERVDALVIGGGEQLSEPRLPNPFWGHLASTVHMVRVARRLGKPVMLWSVGLDELRSPISRWLLRRWLCDTGVAACLRDGPSVERMKRYCGSKAGKLDIMRTADPAFGLPPQDKTAAREWLHNELDLADRGRNVVLLVPANDKLASTSYLESLIEYGRRQAKAGSQVLGWVTDLQPAYDMAIKALPAWEGIDGFKWLPPKLYRQAEFAKIVAGVDFVLSARMHPLIVALTQSTPMMVLARSAKMHAFANMCELPMLSTSQVTADVLQRVSTLALAQGVSAANSAALAERRNEAAAVSDLFAHRFLPAIQSR